MPVTPLAQNPNDSAAWHAETPEMAATTLKVNPASGLAATETSDRLTVHGPNQLASKPPRPAWLKFLDQFKNFLVIVLLGAAVLAGAVGDLKDSIVIAIVVLLNAALGFFQEHRAEAALAALKNMLAPSARVRRDGQAALIPAVDLVPGDILLLEAGDRIPADARVLHAHAAEVAEAALTGESHAVAKSPEAVDEKSALAERRSMVFMNTVVTRGRIEAIVTTTGMHTEMGKIAGLLAEAAESATPLQVQLDKLGKRLAAIAGVVVALIFVIGVLRGDDLVQTAMTAIALAVAAIPEGLPAVVTVTLALGMHRMAKRHAIVKKLAAVETLGCTTVICSDKTGTLTLNQMTARRLFCLGRRFAVSGEGYGVAGAITPEDGQSAPDWNELLAPAVLCADSRILDGELIGDPTEGALLALAARGGVTAEAVNDRQPRIADAHILTGARLWRLGLYGLTMAVGTLAAYAWGERMDGHDYAVTLAFTTFVLFQFFNIFNARNEHVSAFNRQFFSNGKLWLALAGVVGLQVVAVHWAPAQAVFDTVDLTLADWLLAAAIASSTLLLDEARKLLLVLFAGKRRL